MSGDGFSYVYAAGPDGAWMKIGVTGNPVQRLGAIRATWSSFAELHYVVQVPPDLVMLVETCAHNLLSGKRVITGGRGDTEKFAVSAETAMQTINKAVAMVANGQFTSSMALEYCKSVSPRYHGQRLRPTSVSNISPADIKLSWDRKPTVISTYEYVVTGVGPGPRLSEIHLLGIGLSHEERRLATMEKIEEVRQLIRGGMTVPEAGKVVGLKPSTIYLHLPGGAAALRAEDEIDLPETPTE